LMLL